jgi:glutamate 5-kinase
LTRIFQGKDEGTLLFPKESNISKRKRWIAFFNRAEGLLTVDSGAADALSKGKSLLPVGIKAVSGNFKFGAMVGIQSEGGTQIARGLVEYSSADIDEKKGLKTTEKSGEIIHCDNMVIL